MCPWEPPHSLESPCFPPPRLLVQSPSPKCLCPRGFTHHSSRAFSRKGFLARCVLLLLFMTPSHLKELDGPTHRFDKCLSFSPAQAGSGPGQGGHSDLGFCAKEEAESLPPALLLVRGRGPFSSSLRFVSHLLALSCPQPPACSGSRQPRAHCCCVCLLLDRGRFPVPVPLGGSWSAHCRGTR